MKPVGSKKGSGMKKKAERKGSLTGTILSRTTQGSTRRENAERQKMEQTKNDEVGSWKMTETDKRLTRKHTSCKQKESQEDKRTFVRLYRQEDIL